MADAIVSAVAEQIVVLIAEQARFHINLVRGAEEDVLQLSDELNTIRFVLDDAENRRFKDDMVNYWLSRLEHTSREMEDVLDEWKYAILKLEMEQHQTDDVLAAAPKQKLVCSFIPSSSCLCFKKVVVRHDIAKKILNVKAKLDEVLKEKDRYDFVRSEHTAETSHKSWRDSSTSFTNLEEILGRDSDRDILVTKLMGKPDQELGSIHVVSIVGVGGLGKTALAQKVYSDSRVEKFFDLRIWVCVSDPFNLAAIAKGIIESVKKGDSPSTDNLQTLLQSVSDSIAGKTFLLVLDDVWTDDYKKWDPLKTSLKCGGMGSKILVTTRNEKVAKVIGTMDDDIHRPGELSHEDSWLLLRHMADQPEIEFEKIGKEIAKKCKGLPLAIKTLGSVLRFKNTSKEWETVLESEVWQLKEAKTELFPHLLLSYNELSPTLKRCFSYCAAFPKDFRINVESLIGNWMALGYLGSDIGNMELKGQECFDILVRCSLFQDFEKKDLDGNIGYCKMHDIVHDFAQFLRKSGKVETTGMNKRSCLANCDPALISTANEFRSLFLSHEECPQNSCGCLKRLKVLKVSNCKSIPQGIENMIHLRWLKLHAIDELSPVALKFIFQLYNLQTLALSSSELEEIPSELRNLIHLRYLDLSFNRSLKELCMEIGNLIQLRHLDLSGNKSLMELPMEIGNLIHLTYLDLSRNESLKELPREIGNLIQLRHLDVSWNESLMELPREIGNLIHLTHLNLSWNKSLKELPREIGNLIQLRHLDLSWNESLMELPREIGNLIHLTHLDLSGNKSLKELPREIGNLIHLTHLHLSWNKSLKELPREIGNLIQLRHLDVNWNESLMELPREIGNLIQLRHLDLSWNKSLMELPREIGNLIHLTHLNLLGNESLKELPREIGNLIHLIHLDLSCNKSLMELLREIGNLIHLTHLDLSGNESLKELPTEIGNLIHLTHLDLSGNESLKELPREIGNLIQLRHLDVSWNESLEELPGEIDLVESEE